MLNDIRLALRAVIREPCFAAVVIPGLATGTGANTAIFSVVNGILLRPLPYPEPDRLVKISEVVQKISRLYPKLPANLYHFCQ